jgi:hypothetical protein
MPSTDTSTIAAGLSRAERLEALGRAGRLGRYERGELSIADLSLWAARYPEEAPLVNGEFAWISLTLADLD